MRTAIALFFVVVSTMSCLAESSPLSNWTWRQPRPQGNPLYAVSFGAGRFVAVGYGGTILSSSNGVEWQRASVDCIDTFTALGYGNVMFVAGTQTGGVFVSSNGTSWNQAGPGLPGAISGIAFGENEFLAVMASGWLARSSNALTWTVEQLSPSYYPLTGVAYGDGAIVVLIQNALRGRILTLPHNQTNWVTNDVPQRVLSTTWGGGKFVVVGQYGQVLVSADGTNWQSGSGFAIDGYLYGVAFGTSGYVAGGATSVGSRVGNSTDGSTWQEASTFDGETLRSFAFGNGVYVAVGHFGEIRTSSDGVNWISRRVGPQFNLKSITHGNNHYVAVGDDTGILKSSDGINWLSRTAALASATVSGVAFGNNRFVAVTRDVAGKVLCSTNSDDWQVIDPGSNNGLWSVTFGKGTFVAVGANGVVFSSTDGQSWSTHYAGTNWNLNAVVYDGEIFVAVGGGVSGPSIMAYSVDGTNWTSGFVAQMGALNTVVYGNGIFVTAGAISTLAISTNGSNWTTQSSPLSYARALAFGDGQFVMNGGDYFGDRGTLVYTSTNGINWTLRAESFCYSALNALTFHQGRFLAVGDRGTILESGSSGFPRLAIAWVPATGQVRLCITALQGSSYRLQSRTNFTTGVWQDETTVSNAVETMCVIENVASGSPSRFFRVTAP